jgi:hypothetical protein
VTLLNEDKTRAITEAACGVACYEGDVRGSDFHGTHAGVCGSWEDAERWLHGEHAETMIRVYPLVPVTR